MVTAMVLHWPYTAVQTGPR